MQTDCAVRTNAVDLRSGPDGLRRCRLCECRGSHCRTWWKGHQPWHVFGGPAMFVWSLVWDELYAMPAETNNTNPIIPYLMMQRCTWFFSERRPEIHVHRQLLRPNQRVDLLGARPGERDMEPWLTTGCENGSACQLNRNALRSVCLLNLPSGMVFG